MSDIKIEICKAQEEDWPYIKEKLEKYVLDGTKADWKQFFVLKKNKKTVAFARILDYGEFFELASLGVDYYYRKKGLAEKMLRFLIDEAKRIDSKNQIYGVTHISEYLKRVGFKRVDNYPDQLEHKKNHICKHPQKISIVRLF